MCEMPAVIGFDDMSIKLIRDRNELNDDKEWSPGMYESDDRLIDANGDWYRLCYRNDKEEFKDKLKGCFINKTESSEINSEFFQQCENLQQSADESALGQLKKNLGLE